MFIGVFFIKTKVQVGRNLMGAEFTSMKLKALPLYQLILD